MALARGLGPGDRGVLDAGTTVSTRGALVTSLADGVLRDEDWKDATHLDVAHEQC